MTRIQPPFWLFLHIIIIQGPFFKSEGALDSHQHELLFYFNEATNLEEISEKLPPSSNRNLAKRTALGNVTALSSSRDSSTWNL